MSLKETLGDAGYLAQTAEDRIGIVHQVIDGITVVFNIFGIIALIAAAFGIINTLLMAVAERTGGPSQIGDVLHVRPGDGAEIRAGHRAVAQRQHQKAYT